MQESIQDTMRVAYLPSLCNALPMK